MLGLLQEHGGVILEVITAVILVTWVIAAVKSESKLNRAANEATRAWLSAHEKREEAIVAALQQRVDKHAHENGQEHRRIVESQTEFAREMGRLAGKIDNGGRRTT